MIRNHHVTDFCYCLLEGPRFTVSFGPWNVLEIWALTYLRVLNLTVFPSSACSFYIILIKLN